MESLPFPGRVRLIDAGHPISPAAPGNPEIVLFPPYLKSFRFPPSEAPTADRNITQ